MLLAVRLPGLGVVGAAVDLAHCGEVELAHDRVADEEGAAVVWTLVARGEGRGYGGWQGEALGKRGALEGLLVAAWG